MLVCVCNVRSREFTDLLLSISKISLNGKKEFLWKVNVLLELKNMIFIALYYGQLSADIKMKSYKIKTGINIMIFKIVWNSMPYMFFFFSLAENRF